MGIFKTLHQRCTSDASSFLGSGENVCANLCDVSEPRGGSGSEDRRAGVPEDPDEPSLASPTRNGGAGVTLEAAGGGEGGEPCCQSSCQSLVSTVCHRGKLLKSLFHLPSAVFEAALEGGSIKLLQARIGRAAGAVLDSHGMQHRHVVRAMAWFDINKVRILRRIHSVYEFAAYYIPYYYNPEIFRRCAFDLPAGSLRFPASREW